MNVGYLLIGVVLLLVTVVDVVWTTIWVEGGAGPLTSPFMAGTWGALRRSSGDSSRILSLAGPIILVGGLAAWLVLFWTGWTLVFTASGHTLVDTVDRGAVSWVDQLYFIGYTMFTLGNGDFAPVDGVWQMVTVLVAGSGMLFVTLSVTYILSVLDAVTQKRAFAINVSGLGSRGEEVVRTAWDGQSFSSLDLQLNTFTSQLDELTTNHKAYPILHYFHSRDREQAPVASVAVLDDALTLLRFGVPEQHRPGNAVLANARASVKSYLETLRGRFIKPADRAPPPPDLASVRDAGVPTTDDREFEAAVDDLGERRRAALGLVESDARRWPERDGE